MRRRAVFPEIYMRQLRDTGQNRPVEGIGRRGNVLPASMQKGKAKPSRVVPVAYNIQ